MCPHTTIYILLYMCPHTTIYILLYMCSHSTTYMLLYVCSYYYIYTTTCVCSYYYIYTTIYVCSYYYICVLILLYMCAHRFRQRRCDGGTRFRWSRLAGRRMWYALRTRRQYLYLCTSKASKSSCRWSRLAGRSRLAGAVWQEEGCVINCVLDGYYYICVRILQHMCPHTTISRRMRYTASYTRVFVLQYARRQYLYLCTSKARRKSSCRSSRLAGRRDVGHCVICVILLYMCPHTTTYVSSYCCTCVYIVAYICRYTA